MDSPEFETEPCDDAAADRARDRRLAQHPIAHANRRTGKDRRRQQRS